MKKIQKRLAAFLLFAMAIMLPNSIHAMHIAEGFLPKVHAAIYFVIAIPFVIYGIKSIKDITVNKPEKKMLLALAGAYVFCYHRLNYQQ